MGSSQGDLPNAHIELEHVSFSYPLAATDERETAPAPALQDVSLSIAAGEHVCVLGGNGSGKSTLLRLMNALLLPSAGSVRVMGSSTSEPGAALEARRQVAMVFQHPEDQMVTSIAADDVAFGPENLGVPRDEIAVRVRESLDAVGMLPLAQADPTDLSGGQKQRVAIAGALAMRPRVLLLDEPSAMLDAEGHRAVQEIIAQLNARGITIVHVTHFMDDALRAGRVIVMERGRVAMDDTPDAVFAQEKTVRRLGLEEPFALRLADALARRGLPVQRTARAEDLATSLHNWGRVHSMHAPADARAASASRPSESAPARNDGAGAPPSPAIRFSHVSFSYTSAANPRKRRRLRLFGRKGRRADGPRAQAAPLALDDATFDVPAGSVTALIGHTGAGKSTAIELACALKVPATGTVIVNGIDTADLDQRRRLRASVGYVSQLPERQLFGQTVYDDVAFGPRNLKLDEDEVRTRVLDALSQLGLDPEPELLERSPFALSGGQQRAVALAGIVAMRQPILVLDEPMAGLDPAGRNRMRALFMQLKAAGTTLLLVTHSMDDAAQLADRVVVLSHGRVTDEGSPEAVFGRAARSRATGVPGLPAPMRFQQELARHGIVPTDPALTIDALADQVAASVPNLGERPPLTARKRARAMAEAR